MPQRKLRAGKTKRIVLRLTEEQELAFEQAAMVQQTTVRQFVFKNALAAAYDAIREQNGLYVSEGQWRTICHELDNPPKSNPALRKLLKSKGVFKNS